MEKVYKFPVCLSCGSKELELSSYYDKVVPFINCDGTVELELQGKESPILSCINCSEEMEFGYGPEGRIIIFDENGEMV